MKLTIDTEFGRAGCRQSRNVEARSGETFVFSAWYYLPRREVPTRDMWNVFQFKSRSPSVVSIGTDPFWTINIVRSRRGGPLRLVLKWKGGDTDHTQGVRGPFAHSSRHPRIFRQRRAVVPIRRWFKISAYLDQSGAFNGRLAVRQNGVLLWNKRRIRTKYPDGWQSWSVGNYSNGIRDSPATIFIDDARVRRPDGRDRPETVSSAVPSESLTEIAFEEAQAACTLRPPVGDLAESRSLVNDALRPTERRHPGRCK
jgi:hypothetical protein